MMNLPLLFRFREPLATLPSLVVLAVLIIAGVQKATELKRKEDPQPVQIALMELPPPPPPQPKPQVEPPPKPVEPPKKQEAPRPVAKPAPVKQTPAPVDPAPPSANAPVVPAPPSTPAAPPVQAAPVAPPAPPPVNTANIEQTYVGQLRAHLNSIKRYPTGREASTLRPQGKVRVWFVLRRDGSVVDSGIESSSNSMLLDDAARKTINRAAFAPFPDDTYKGESTHRFTADLDFIPV
ncbi:TonB family protein [Herbaspirillum seropedicae]|uniref:TonB domain protein n=1 Tax=Herbaspirillum seropedicae (strain SmR1) TaxID=757424 RepID=D8IW20_HERSS|nr:TonB domain protein [Herbaspirillum seropedicae SmR1]AKN64010.1 energy transducer TonB [Herbaspirillum seropedicae]NQE29383.1 energy transducer TonB [Herbaspirillum seropedicae]UMU19924.1 TonB family protein [Herbaspirillum seropedicae]